MNSSENLITARRVAELFGVGVRTLQDWRTSEVVGTKRYLPAYPDPKNKTKRCYKLDDVMDFAVRNPRYLDRVYSKLIHENLLVDGAVIYIPELSHA